MMSSLKTNDPYRVAVIRLVAPPHEAFRCVACGRDILADPWDRREQKAPICLSCTQFWSSPFGRLRGASRADQMTAARLKAITMCLQWEIMNG